MNIKAIWVTFKFAVFTVLLVLCALLLHKIGQSLGKDSAVISDINEGPVIVIDAGHGGEDGGAVGVNGCIEKELNLDIALILNDLLNASGVNTVMTRTEDIMLYDKATPGKKKIQDVRNRVAIAEKNDNSLTVSIHMNTYPSPKYSGAQVYYSPNHEESSALAGTMQNNLKEHLQPDNTRETKAATSAIYLLHNVRTPAVLVECGFISNPTEAELLCDDVYRHKVACTIYASIIEYLNKGI